MSTFKLEVRYCMNNSDINVVGGMLGYNWNDVCNYVQQTEIYGQDGCGYTLVERGDTFDHEQIDAIFEKIFSDNPEVDQIYILN